ncbi:DUF4129 domain-containing protein [Pelagibius marinus]|uniref:DUF4129 domain-containing protein n=1 Tax=Pelagibius marinus TaxID=2762760 RepID=UPI0018729520|nr:DUF4129 domain-containing protein [Pelagibius marinus]
MRLIKGLALCLALALAGPVLVAVATALPALAQQNLHTPGDVAASRDRVLGDSRYQTEKPEPEVAPEVDQWTIPPWLVDTILWGLGAVVAGIILFFLFNLARELLESRLGIKRSPKVAPAEAAKVQAVPPARREAEHRTLAEADALAAEGRFSEAIHLLLLVAMERLRRELGPRVAPAMTSREVLRLSAIPGEATAPLTRMVALSEINHFGGRSAREPEYRNCRDDFLRFNGMEGTPA